MYPTKCQLNCALARQCKATLKPRHNASNWIFGILDVILHPLYNPDLGACDFLIDSQI